MRSRREKEIGEWFSMEQYEHPKSSRQKYGCWIKKKNGWRVFLGAEEWRQP